jgi:HSP20 family protein
MLSRYNVPNPLLPVWGIPTSSGASIHQMMNRLFDNIETAFDGAAQVDPMGRMYAQGNGRIRAQVRDTGDALAMIVELPGLCERDIDVSIEDGVVSLKAARSGEPAVPQGYSPVRRERTRKVLDWSVSLPYAVDTTAATATFEQGRLQVSLPKAPEAKPRSIPVKAAASAEPQKAE